MGITLGLVEMMAAFFIDYLNRRSEMRRIERDEENKQREKLEQEKKKEMELENEKKSVFTHLLSEVESNQIQLNH